MTQSYRDKHLLLLFVMLLFACAARAQSKFPSSSQTTAMAFRYYHMASLAGDESARDRLMSTCAQLIGKAPDGTIGSKTCAVNGIDDERLHNEFFGNCNNNKTNGLGVYVLTSRREACITFSGHFVDGNHNRS